MVKDAVGGTVMNEKTMQLEDVQMTIPMAFIRWKADSAREQAEDMKEETFSQMLMRLMDERGVIARDLYTEACIDRKLFSKIKKHEDYQPKKYTAICLALGLRLSLSETKKLLETAGFALSRSIREDRVIADCIAKDKRSVWQVNRMLRASGLKELVE